MRLHLVPRAAHADFLDLPWHEPLEAWESSRLVEVPRGIGRHVVRFVDYAGTYFALKELPPEIAAREYRMLRALDARGIAAVEAVGVVGERARPHEEELPDVLITRYLDFSLPYRLALARRPAPDQLERLLDAFAQLLVRLHLTGFFWGDCSLSNALFRRDAGELAAYLVDAETGELQPRLSDGQREYDLQIAEENVFGELLDVEAQAGGEGGEEAAALAAEIPARYERLWAELTAEEVLRPGEAERFEARLQRLNELGFDADEVEIVETADGFRLRLEPKVMEPGHHRRRLLRLTGLDAQENQARRLLADIDAYRRRLAAGPAPPSETAAVGRWLAEVFEPALAAVPPDLRDRRDAAQLFHELLEHRWYLSERAGEEVPLDDAVADYIDSVLRSLPDERRVIGPAADEYGLGYG